MSVSIFDPDFPDLPRGGSGPPRRCMELSLEKVHNAEPNGDEERRGGDVWFLAWV